MPRWAQILLTLVLFAAAMAVTTATVKATVPDAVGWLQARIGVAGVGAAMVMAAILAALFVYWPRNPDGSFRSLSRRS